jgi:hypothetical protein
MSIIKDGAHAHGANRDGSGVLAAALAVVAVLAALAVVAAVRWVTSHWLYFAVPAAAVLAALAVVAVVRFACLDRSGKWHWVLCRWHRFGWKRLSRNLQLALPDRHRGGIDSSLPKKVNYPRRVRFRPDSFGWTVAFRPPPGVTREDVEKQAESLADRWRCSRVGVSKPAAGKLVLRACRRDPLTEPVPAAILPPWDGRHLVLGRDELGSVRLIDLANLSGSVIGGNPGRGKTESASGMAVQLVPEPRVELYVLDGGANDWAPLAPVAVAYADDNLADAEELLLELHSRMMTRRRSLQADLGVRNGWSLGPSTAHPFRWLLVDESAVYFDLESAKGDRDRERRVRACRGLALQLLRRGRAAMHHTTLICQKPTGTGGLPPDLRDLAGARWSFGCATAEVAVSVLGDDIRRYDTLSPVLLQEAEHVGIATVLLKSGLDPFTRVKFPAIGEARLDTMVSQVLSARTPAPDDARELVG